MDEDLKQLLDAIRAENAAAHTETRRQFEIITEGLRSQMQIVAEGVSMNNEKIDRFDAKIDQITDDLEVRVTGLEAMSSRRSK
jgi:fructose-1-phosphate kinase PfkB-like protein